MTDRNHEDRTVSGADDPAMSTAFVSRLSRRGLLKVALGASAATVTTGLLAACGGDDDDDDDSSSDATATEETSGSDETATEAEEETSTEAAEETEASAEETETSAEETEAASEETEPAETEEAEATGSATEEEVDAANCTVGGTLIYALSADPPNMDPHVSTGTAADNVKNQLYNGLLRYHSDATTSPDLAESWEVSDDGLTYTFVLREGVTFHNGDPFTSEDVKASYERILDPAVGSTNLAEMSAIDTIDTPDELTAVLNLSVPSAPLPSYLAGTETFILSKNFLDGGGDPNLDVIGTGAFKLDSMEPGVRISVVKNEDYFWPDLPYLDGIDFIPYADEDTRMAAALSGEVHVAEYVPWKDYERIRNTDNVKLHSGDAAAYMCVMYGTDKPPFDNVDVRYALNWAYDRQAIMDIVFFGEGSPITGGLVPPGFWGHDDALDGTFGYDPDKAKQMLADAGFPDGFDCTLLSTSQYGMHQGTAEICQQNLRDIGINCELELYDWATVVDMYARGDFQFRIHGLGTGGADPDTTLTQYFDSESAAAQSIAFANDEVDGLLQDARATTDQDERKGIYDQAQELIAELSPFNFLNYRVQSEVTSADVRGYEHYIGGLFAMSSKSLEQVRIGCTDE